MVKCVCCNTQPTSGEEREEKGKKRECGVVCERKQNLEVREIFGGTIVIARASSCSLVLDAT